MKLNNTLINFVKEVDLLFDFNLPLNTIETNNFIKIINKKFIIPNKISNKINSIKINNSEISDYTPQDKGLTIHKYFKSNAIKEKTKKLIPDSIKNELLSLVKREKYEEFDKLFAPYQTDDLHQTYFDYETMSLDRKDSEHLYSHFMSSNIHRSLSTDLNKHLIVNFDIDEDLKVNLNYYFKNNFSNLELFHVLRILSIVNNVKNYKYKTSKINKKLDLHIWKSNQEKKLSKSSKIDFLTQYNVNSGSATNGNKGRVYIWRNEELIKVLFHELNHFFRLDLDHYNTNTKSIREIYDNTKVLQNKFDNEELVQYQDSINESFTDFTAFILQSLYMLNSKKNFWNYFDIDRKFALLQCAKVLQYYNFPSYSCFIGREEDDKGGSKYLKATTNIFSYYVVKAALLHNLNESIEFWRRYLSEHEEQSSPKLINKFSNLVMSSLFRSEFISVMDNLIKENFSTIKNYSHFKDTLRMSCLLK